MHKSVSKQINEITINKLTVSYHFTIFVHNILNVPILFVILFLLNVSYAIIC